MSVSKSATFSGKPVNVGRFDFRCTIATKVAKAEIVDKDQNDVGPSLIGLSARAYRDEKKKNDGNDENGVLHDGTFDG